MTRRSFFVKDRYDFSVVFFGCLSGSLWSSSFLFLVFESGSCRLDRSESWSLPISFANQLISYVHPQRCGLNYENEISKSWAVCDSDFIFYNHLICQKEYGHKVIWSSTTKRSISILFADDLKGEASTPILIDVQKQKTDLWIQNSEITNPKSRFQNLENVKNIP